MTDNKKSSYKEMTSIDEPITFYGFRWVDWMHENHPDLVSEMKRKDIFHMVAMSIDKSAWDYRDLLESQYANFHPRPETFEEIVKWEFTRNFYIDSSVMREKVLIPLTSF